MKYQFPQPKKNNRPHTPIVPMDLSDTQATHRLVAHATKRVIKTHKDELQKLAYR